MGLAAFVVLDWSNDPDAALSAIISNRARP